MSNNCRVNTLDITNPFRRISFTPAEIFDFAQWNELRNLNLDSKSADELIDLAETYIAKNIFHFAWLIAACALDKFPSSKNIFNFYLQLTLQRQTNRETIDLLEDIIRHPRHELESWYFIKLSEQYSDYEKALEVLVQALVLWPGDKDLIEEKKYLEEVEERRIKDEKESPNKRKDVFVKIELGDSLLKLADPSEGEYALPTLIKELQSILQPKFQWVVEFIELKSSRLLLNNEFRICIVDQFFKEQKIHLGKFLILKSNNTTDFSHLDVVEETFANHVLRQFSEPGNFEIFGCKAFWGERNDYQQIMGYEMLHPSQVIVKQLQETLEKFSDAILNVVGKDESVEEVAKIRKISPYKLDQWEFLNYRNLVDPNECGKMLNELISENRKEEQLKVAHASLEKFPENEDLLSIVGMLEMSNKNWWLASFYFEKLIEKQKDRVELTTYENLLESLIRDNQFDRAYKFIATAHKKWPNSQKILDILVMLQRATKSNL